MNSNDEIGNMRSIIIAQQDALKQSKNRYDQLAKEYESLIRSLPEREDTPNQCELCSLWYHPDKILFCGSSCKNKCNSSLFCKKMLPC
jgi:hypothetical protein